MMCGISGYYDLSGAFDTRLLNKMNSLLRHRGPDASAIFTDGPAGLAHCRLSIIDLRDIANQPMQSHCGRYMMAYNGEVYNFRELLKKIQSEDPLFLPRTDSDTEIVLQAFAMWGTAFLDHLNGMFAMAIYDLHAQAMYLIRDRMGIKPLFYYQDQQGIAFASELKALTAPGNLPHSLTIDQEAISRFLHLGYIPAPYTIYRQIRKFPAGSYARVDSQGMNIQQWWSPAAAITAEVISDKHEALERLEQLLEDSVSHRLIADVPYGTFLSGGIDSSLVTAVAQKVNQTTLNTFTVGFPGSASNEAHFAKQIADHLGTRHHELLLTEKEILDWLPVFFETYDEPYADSSGIPSLLIAHFARRHVTMTLSGDGGDELFLGYGAYRWAQRLDRLGASWVRNLTSQLLLRGNQRMQRASSLFRYESSATMKSHIFSQEQYCFTRTEIREILLNEPANFTMEEEYAGLARELAPEEQQALFDLHYYLPDDLLVKIDRATMAASLETRVPLLDYRLAEFALNLHPSLKDHQGTTKWLLKELLKKYIPQRLFERPKKGFSIPLQQWLYKELKFLADEYLSEEAILKTGILQPDQVKRLLHNFYHHKKQYLYQRVWLLIVLQQWLLKNKS
ncbi:MAG: asparagine synthase (glutamine-hydrolyzing) [Bacteroidales bacterium]